MGLMDSVYCEIPGADKVRIDVPKDTVTLSKMAYGYSVELSPMQILMFYNAIANGGKMVRPMLVTAIQQNGETEKTFKSEVGSLGLMIAMLFGVSALVVGAFFTVWTMQRSGDVAVL